MRLCYYHIVLIRTVLNYISMEYLFLIFFIVFGNCESVSLSPTNSSLTWAEARSRCNLANQSIICGNTSSSSSCNVILDNGSIDNTDNFTAWVDGYVTQSPFMRSVGCYNVTTTSLLYNTRRLKIAYNDVKSCSLSCGYSLYYGLEEDSCFCINQTIDNFVSVNKNTCNSNCAGRIKETCGGDTGAIKILTVFSVTDGDIQVLQQNCRSVSASLLAQKTSKKVFAGTNSYLSCHVCGFSFALEGENCYCLNGVELPLTEIDNSACNVICPGNQFERCGGVPFTPPYNYLTLYQTLPVTQPGYSAYGENCAVVIRTGEDSYITTERNCNESNRFICDSASQGRVYANSEVTWENAKMFCELTSDGLSVQFYYKNLALHKFYWIGYFRESSIMWDKDYSESMGQQEANCLALSKKGNTYTLMTVDCNINLKALCVNDATSEKDGSGTEGHTTAIETDMTSVLTTNVPTTDQVVTETLRTNNNTVWNAAYIGLTTGLVLALILLCVIAGVCLKKKKGSHFKTLKSTASVKSFEFRKPSLRRKPTRINTQSAKNGSIMKPNSIISQELYDEIPYAASQNRTTIAVNSTYDDVIIGKNGAGIIFDAKKNQKLQADHINNDNNSEQNTEYSVYQVLEENEDTDQNSKSSENSKKSKKEPVKNSLKQVDTNQMYHALEETADVNKECSLQKEEPVMATESETSFYHYLEGAVNTKDTASLQGTTSSELTAEYSMYHVLNDNNDSKTSNGYQMYDHI